MRKVTFTLAFLWMTAAAFSQQLPLRIVNNTSQNMQVFVHFYGDGALAPPECTSCNNDFTSEWFDVLAGDFRLLEIYQDFDSSPPIQINCPAPGGLCSGAQTAFYCGAFGTNEPIWWLIEFQYPGIGSKIGDPGCGATSFFSNGSFTASWTVVGGEIVVLFND